MEKAATGSSGLEKAKLKRKLILRPGEAHATNSFAARQRDQIQPAK
jgi:hypothetical protein